MINIHCLNNISESGLSRLPDNYNKEASFEEAQAVLVRSAKMHDMEFGEELLAIARAGAGVNNIPLERCAEEGIVVFNTPGANANAVKEQVLAGMLLASRDLMGGAQWVKDNASDEDIAKSAEKAKKAFAGQELKGKKLGVIGLGAIGRLVANACVELGMDVMGYDPYLSVSAAWNISRKVKHTPNVDDIYRECDYITIHVPALDSTKGMVGKDAFSVMKPGVIIINCSRDVLVDEDELLKAIEEGTVAKYVTDFANPTVAGKDHIICFPHLGASTMEAEENCAVMAVEQLRDYIENGNIRNSVNFPACDMGECQSQGRIAVFHKNVPNVISKITATMGDANLNISDMTNKSKDNSAYTLLDIDAPADDAIVEKLKGIDGVLKVRVVK